MTVVSTVIDPSGRIDRSERARLFRPGWPLAWLLYGFPFFWALGILSFAVMIMAVPMAVHLSRWRPLKLPRGFVFWALFLVWSLGGLIVLGVNPPGTVPEPASSRIIGFAVREASYLSVTVVLLYVGNISEQLLSTRRIAYMLGWLFIFTVVGGVAGILFPDFEFTSPFEMILPGSIANNLYLQQLSHPTLAQVQDVVGEGTPRPAAPFGYTNAWSFHLTILGVWFVSRWLLGSRFQRQLVSAPVLIAGAVVLILSFNRGAWLGSLLAVVLAVALLALRGKLLPLAIVTLVAAIAGLVFIASPLSSLAEARLEDGHSDDIRTFTSERALELSANSPIVGYGATRNALGSSSSIAVGKSESCPQCGNVSIGINGYFFMLLMTTGWIGTALFYLMWITQIWHARGDPSPWVTSAVIVLVLTIFYGFTYDVATWMFVPMVSSGLLWREAMRRDRERELRAGVVSKEGSTL